MIDYDAERLSCELKTVTYTDTDGCVRPHIQSVFTYENAVVTLSDRGDVGEWIKLRDAILNGKRGMVSIHNDVADISITADKYKVMFYTSFCIGDLLVEHASIVRLEYCADELVQHINDLINYKL